MWWVVILVAVGGPLALYGLFTLYTVVRLKAAGRRLARECAPRGFEITTKLFVLIPEDYEDPITLEVELRRGERRFSFTVFRSLMSSPFTAVHVEPLALLGPLGRGRVALDPTDNLSGAGSSYVTPGEAEIVTFGIEEMDALYRLRSDRSRPITTEALESVRLALAHPETRAALAAFGGSVTFEYGHMKATPGARGKPFFDGLEQIARLADALDAAVTGPAPYR